MRRRGREQCRRRAARRGTCPRHSRRWAHAQEGAPSKFDGRHGAPGTHSAPGHASGVVGDSLGDSLETAQTPPYLTGSYRFKRAFISQHAGTSAFRSLIGEMGGALPRTGDGVISEVQVTVTVRDTRVTAFIWFRISRSPCYARPAQLPEN